MALRIFYLIVLSTCCCNIYGANIPRGRVRIGETFNTNNQQSHQQQPLNTATKIYMPTGFNPQPPPVQPLLYPFHTPTRPTWKPVVHMENTTPRIIPISSPPMLEDRISVDADDVEYVDDELLLPTQSIVYGQRKPNETIEVSGVVNVSNQPHSRNITIERPVDTLKAMIIAQQLHRLGIEEQQHESEYNKAQFEQPSRIIKRPKSTQNGDTYTKRPEVVQLETTDPKFRQMAQQINQSEERNKYPYLEEREETTTEDNWMPMVPKESEYELAIKNAIRRIMSKTTMATTKFPATTTTTTTTTPMPAMTTPVIETTITTTTTAAATTTKVSTTAEPMNWPADFSESTPYALDTLNDTSATYQGDNTDLPNYYDDLSLVESLTPQLAVNITKVGIPYEERNSAEEPTICVPLTVSETMQANAKTIPEIIEVERVYCFPLPLPELKVKVGNMPTESTTTPNNNTHQQVNKASKGQLYRASYQLCWLMSVLLLWMRSA